MLVASNRRTAKHSEYQHANMYHLSQKFPLLGKSQLRAKLKEQWTSYQTNKTEVSDEINCEEEVICIDDIISDEEPDNGDYPHLSFNDKTLGRMSDDSTQQQHEQQ